MVLVKKDYTDEAKILLIVAIIFYVLIFVACDGGWSIAGYEI